MSNILKSQKPIRGSSITGSQFKYELKLGRKTLEIIVNNLDTRNYYHKQELTFGYGYETGTVSFPSMDSFIVGKREYEQLKKDLRGYKLQMDASPNIQFIIVEEYKFFRYLVYTFNNRKTYDIIIADANLDILKQELEQKGIASEINGNFLRIKDVTPKIKFQLDDMLIIETPLLSIYGGGYDELLDYLENDPDLVITYLERNIYNYPRFAKLIIDNGELSYYPEIIRLGKLYIGSGFLSPDIMKLVNEYIATASLAVGGGKSIQELDGILRNLAASENTPYNVRLRNKIFTERVGLPIGYDLGFDVNMDVDTIIKLGIKIAELYKEKKCGDK